MIRRTLVKSIGFAAIALVAVAGAAPSARAYDDEILVTGQAGVRVWVDGGDIFPDYADVSVYVRADRDCYATLLLVDTAGYLHVLYPSSPYERAWLYGGRTYRYRACDLGLDQLDGVGIAHLYAVGSPVPFDYSYYGASVFVGGFGFRIHGDPYIACHDFYVSLLPVSCRWDFVDVSCARFYVREWVRYPSYLCSPGYGVHVRVGDSCRECSGVYASYRYNVASPYEVLRPEPRKFKSMHVPERAVAPMGRVEPTRTRAAMKPTRSVREPVDALVRDGGVRKPVRVVSTSRSGGTAKTAVKTSDRRISASLQRGNRGGGDARVVRKPTVATKGAGAPKQSVAATKSIAPRKSVATTKKSDGKASHKKGAGKRVRQAQ